MKQFKLTISMGDVNRNSADGPRFFGTVKQDIVNVEDDMSLERYLKLILFFQGNVEEDAVFAFVVVEHGDDIVEWRKPGVETLVDFDYGERDIDDLIAKIHIGEDLGLKRFLNGNA